MMRKKLVVAILAIIMSMPVLMVQTDRHTKAVEIPVVTQTSIPQSQSNNQNDVRITCYVGGQGGMRHTSMLVSRSTAALCFNVFHQLRENLTKHPFSERTQQLKETFISLLAQNNLIPQGIPESRYHTLMTPPWLETPLQHHRGTTRVSSPVRSGIASAVLCDLSGEGVGLMFPFIMLPRPRIVTVWMGNEGDTIVGKFLTIGGFDASGQQFGTALGFWGIGFAVAYPYGNVYGFAGYALFVTITADQIDSYPPNQPPVITGTNPHDNEMNVPLTLPELSFTINDPDGDLMSYTVTTSPNIGSGSGNLKPSGTYTIPIQGLQDLTQYSWTISVSDKQHTTQQTFTFTTQAVAPVVSNPVPADGSRRVPTNLQQLKFTLKDFQGDRMNYTVETSPFIGSTIGSNVYNGTYTVTVSGLNNATMYRWFVNVTDGQHWTRKVYRFETPYPDVFNPFEYGWHYRKQITIDHTNIAEDITDFPVLIDITDTDLSQKAQQNGYDILFMNSTGVAPRLDYEIESYDGSSGNLVAWVNISYLSSSTDTIFYMYYGNPNCLSQQNPLATWDSYYKGVWHMNDATATTIMDSTAGVHTGQKVNVGHPLQATSKIGDAQNFVPDDCISVSDSSVFTMNDGTHDVPFTLELWMYATTINNHHTLLSKDAQGSREWYLQTYGYGDYPRFIYMLLFDNNAGGTYIEDKYYYDFQPNIWYQITVTYDGSQSTSGLTLYLNGQPVTWSEVTNTGYTMMHSTGIPVFMGKDDWSGDPAKYYYGILDEVRISKGIARSADWISTCYKNQNDPGSFILVGPEEPGP